MDQTNFLTARGWRLTPVETWRDPANNSSDYLAKDAERIQLDRDAAIRDYVDTNRPRSSVEAMATRIAERERAAQPRCGCGHVQADHDDGICYFVDFGGRCECESWQPHEGGDAIGRRVVGSDERDASAGGNVTMAGTDLTSAPAESRYTPVVIPTARCVMTGYQGDNGSWCGRVDLRNEFHFTDATHLSLANRTGMSGIAACPACVDAIKLALDRGVGSVSGEPAEPPMMPERGPRLARPDGQFTSKTPWEVSRGNEFVLDRTGSPVCSLSVESPADALVDARVIVHRVNNFNAAVDAVTYWKARAEKAERDAEFRFSHATAWRADFEKEHARAETAEMRVAELQGQVDQGIFVARACGPVEPGDLVTLATKDQQRIAELEPRALRAESLAKQVVELEAQLRERDVAELPEAVVKWREVHPVVRDAWIGQLMPGSFAREALAWLATVPAEQIASLGLRKDVAKAVLVWQNADDGSGTIADADDALFDALRDAEVYDVDELHELMQASGWEQMRKAFLALGEHWKKLGPKR